MKKSIILLVIFFTNFIYAQLDYSNVVNLLVNNKREEARKLFDKQFGKIKATNVDLLFLDAFIDQESGKIDFDETFVKNLEKLPNSQYFIAPFINNNLILNDVKDDSYNDLSYKKMDFLSSSPKFKDLPIIKYRKGVFEHKRYRKDKALEAFESLKTIKEWQFCGVFENLNSSGLDIEYEPELYAKNDKQFDANSNGIIGWYNPKAPQEDPYHFFETESEYGAGIIYAQTFIDASQDKNYVLSFGANLGLKVFLNDKEIYVNTDIKRTNLDAYSIKLPLKKGCNRLLFKLELGSRADYFSAQIRDLDFKSATDLTFSNTYKPYVSSNEAYEAEEIQLDYEKYFDDLAAKNPNNILYKLFQFKAYESNYKKVKAFDAIEGLDVKYPNSSFISEYFINYYDMLGDESQKIKEILKNMESNDPEYYFVIFAKLVDRDWLKSSSINDLEKYKNISKKYKQRYAEIMFDFMLASRKSDIDEMLKKIDELKVDSYNSEKITMLCANLYESLKDDKSKAIAILENLVNEKEVYEAKTSLINYYNNQNRKEDVKKILMDRINTYPYLNSFRNDYIDVLVNENQYDKALALIDENLSYYPYSFTNLERKANIYSLQKNTKEAEKYIRKSLIYNSSNEKIRKQLYDITKTPDEIEEVVSKNIYKIAKDRRGKTKLKNDYGVVVLLDEYIVNVLPEGGRKAKVNYLYEITSESGIESMKEYSLDSGYTILKSEIIKQDGSLVPAEKGNDMLVFSNLKVGDVIYIDYESFDNAYGRFYRDFNISSHLNGVYPSEEAIFTLIHPANVEYLTSFNNGDLASTVKKINGKTCVTWKRSNIPSIPLQENYAPNSNDLTNSIRVSTIKSWKDITNWYADLVKKCLKTDKITQKTFEEIFPNGVQGISQEEIAKKIYTYIEKNITYSSLDFRQSGYVPQKPSKTITTKLGDCKDVSTLFVALSQYAGLKSNLVLVLTNDNGYNSMRLPSKDFNHCIVKTMLDGKEVFLELTDKYLPFRSLPNSLYKSNALVISFDKNENEKSKIISIPFDNAIPNVTKTNTVVTIDDKLKTFVNKHTIQGSNKSYYNELFSAATTEDVRKKELEDNYNTRLKKVITMQSIKLLTNESFDKDMSYETQFSIAESLQKVGNLKITDLPFLDKAYTRDIISSETRKYDINYLNYENTNKYESEMILNIAKDKKFFDIPQNKSLTFKNHNYAIQFELMNDSSLKVKREVSVPWDNITIQDYPEYKKFVEGVIEIEEQIVGFK